MAYSSKYVFGFYSEVANSDVTITISEDGYTGSVKNRNLGGAPILRREMNGHIHGTSCTLTLEAQDNDDYMEFYTSDPRKFQVTITRDSYTIFNGFITPELLNVPDLSAPYDVEITAVDGLGELKYITYGEVTSGGHTFEDIISSICAATGNSSTVSFYDRLAAKINRSHYVNVSFVSINLDSMAGESCYDVLEGILTSINAEIVHSANDGEFFVIAKADLDNYSSNFENAEFGSMSSCDFWPIGHLTSSMVPAKNQVRVKAESKMKLLSFPFSGHGLTVSETIGDYCSKQDDGSYFMESSPADTLYIRLYETFSPLSAIEGDVTVVCRAQIDSYEDAEDFGEVKLRLAVEGKDGVTTRIQESQEVTISAIGERYDEVTLKCPVLKAQKLGCDTFRVYLLIANRNVNVNVTMLKIYGSAPVGYESTLDVANGAREALDEQTGLIAMGDTADYTADQHLWRYCIPYYNDVTIEQWTSTGRGAAEAFMTAMGMMYAKQYAEPRVSWKGTLNTPSDLSRIPLMLSRGEGHYFVDTAEWNLVSDEITVSLDGMPTATIAATETVTKKYGSQAVPDEL